MPTVTNVSEHTWKAWEACLEWQSMGGMSELQPVVVIF